MGRRLRDKSGRGQRYLLPRFRRFRRRNLLAAPPPPVEGELGADYVPSPDDFLPSPPKPISRLNQKPNIASIKPALFCFALFWLCSLHDWLSPDADGLWASNEAVIGEHQYWRLLTALFVHSDIGHLLANSPLFLIFGWFLYAFFGWLAFPASALIIGTLSNLVTIYFYPPDTELLGASGMLYGMVALWLVVYVRHENTLPWGVRLLRAVGVSLLLLFPTTFREETSYTAHLAGFVIGIAVGFIGFRGPSKTTRTDFY